MIVITQDLFDIQMTKTSNKIGLGNGLLKTRLKPQA